MKLSSSKKNALVKFRIAINDKANLQALAKQRGISLSKLVMSCLANRSVPDFTARLQLLNGIGQLVKEMNAIGNNINQTTIAIHLINQGRKIAEDEFKNVIDAIRTYQVKELEIKSLINKLFDEQFDV